MIVELRHCHRCKSTNIVKNGKNRSGTQTYKCKDCGCYRVVESKQASRRIDMGLVERIYPERQSLRATARVLKVSHRTVLNWLKEKRNNSLISSLLLSKNKPTTAYKWMKYLPLLA
jgi:transposase-like protein